VCVCVRMCVTDPFKYYDAEQEKLLKRIEHSQDGSHHSLEMLSHMMHLIHWDFQET